MKRILVSVLLVIGVAVALTFTGPRRADVTTISGSTMGTTYTVRLVEAGTPRRQQAWQRTIQACLDQIDARMSTYKTGSDVSRFNRSTSMDWFPVSRDTALVVVAALDIARLTDGAFDITVGPLVNLWSFGPDQRPLGVPTDDEIATALAAVGSKHIEARLEPPALRKNIPPVAIDLSGIAKGFAVDQVSQLLSQAGIRSYMIEIGGEVRTEGTRPDGASWRIGIERPVSGRRDLAVIVNLPATSLATSGDYRNCFQWEGRLYSHEIDPHTGRPVEHRVASVSVMDASAMRADALATGLMVMEPDEAWRLAGELKLEIMMILRSEQVFEERVTPGFAATIVEQMNRGDR